MKHILRIEDSLTNKISYYHIIAFMACLPFDRFFSELILISFLLHELIHLDKEKITGVKLPVLLPVLIYVVTVSGALYSPDKVQLYKDLEKQLALVLFPVIFSLTSIDLKTYRQNVLKAFAFIMLATVLYLYLDAFSIIRFNKLALSSLLSPLFINHNFSLPINLHATYLSMYVTLAASIFLKFCIDAVTLRNRLLYALGLMILLMGVIQLSSKAVFIAVIIIINFATPILIRTKKNRIRFLAASIIITTLIIVALMQVEGFKIRYVEKLQQDLQQTSYNVNIAEPRMVRWRCALTLIKQSPVIGHGSGSETNLLKEIYFNNKLYISYLNELNAHNQYLSFLIKSGVIGLLVFLYVLLAGFKQAILKKDFIFCSFLIVISVVAMSENILDVNKGIFFFAFFYPLFIKSGGK